MIYNLGIKIKKGYLGICKEVNGDTARIELHTNAKIVSIPRSDIDEPGRSKRMSSNNHAYLNSNRNEGGKTPAYGSGSKTPMQGDGGKTPYWYFTYILLYTYIYLIFKNKTKGIWWKNSSNVFYRSLLPPNKLYSDHSDSYARTPAWGGSTPGW